MQRSRLSALVRHPKLALVAAASLAFLAVLLWCRAPGFVVPAKVSASASLDAQHGPERTLDRNILETPRDGDAWLLPDRSLGFIRYDFDRAYALSAIELLNTRNRLLFDRATTVYRVELDGKSEERIAAEPLPFYPAWRMRSLPDVRVRSVVIHVAGFAGKGAGLLEVAFRGRPVRSGQLALDLACALAAALLTWFVGPWLVRRLGAARSTMLACSLLVIYVGMELLYFSSSVPVFEWMLIFRVEEIQTFAQALSFFAELRVPLPPWLAALEIGTYWLTGGAELVTRTFYKATIIGSYLLVLWLLYPSVLRMLLGSALALLLIAGTASVHPVNPQVYDTVFGFMTLLFLALLAWAQRTPRSRLRTVLLVGAGTVLSLWGLTRPFAVFLMPLPLGFALLQLRPLRRAEQIALLAPLVLLFGVWNAQLYVRHGQVGISNHTGVNLIRGWSMVAYPPWLSERTMPPWRELNNPDHLTNSKNVQRKVLTHIVEHPRASLHHAAQRLLLLLSMHTNFVGRHDASGEIVVYYKLVVGLCMSLVILALLARAWALLLQLVRAAPRRQPMFVLRDLVLLMTFAVMMIVVVGEAGEEVRFVVSFLPLLALVATLPARDTSPPTVRPA